MDASEFWCRSFLAAMGSSYQRHEWENHDAPAAYCEAAANAHLAVAQRRGMVTGERVASAQPTTPELERVEFTAELTSYGNWVMRAPEWGGVVCVTPGLASIVYNGTTFRIRWGETMPPKPIEVWLERC